MEALLPIRFVAAAAYLAASVAYILLLKSGGREAKAPTALLGVGLVLHGVEVLARGAEAGAAGGAPFSSLSGFVSIFSFVIGVTYFLLERRYARQYRIVSLGAFHVPCLFVLHTWSALLKQPVSEVSELRSGIVFVIHVAPAICAYAALTVAFVAGVAYLLLDRQLRTKRMGVLMRGLPNLDLVERVNAAAVKIGVPLLLVAFVMGFAQGHLALGSAFRIDFKVWVTLLSIVIFGGQLLARRFAGWTGRRGVLLSVFGFVVILINATIMNAFFSSFHGFQ